MWLQGTRPKSMKPMARHCPNGGGQTWQGPSSDLLPSRGCRTVPHHSPSSSTMALTSFIRPSSTGFCPSLSCASKLRLFQHLETRAFRQCCPECRAHSVNNLKCNRPQTSTSSPPLRGASCFQTTPSNRQPHRNPLSRQGTGLWSHTPPCLSVTKPYGFWIYRVPRIRPLSRSAVRMVPFPSLLIQVTATVPQSRS